MLHLVSSRQLCRNSSLASDRQGQLVERDRHPPVHRLLDRQLVVPSADILHEGMPDDHDWPATFT
jgi:hypothetical protein